ncbi:MAG: GNAT family N-acetyltransferase [Acidobacteriota bacterium]
MARVSESELSFGPLGGEEDVEACARMMAESEPWRTLRRGYTECLARVRDETKERYTARDAGGLAGFLILDMRGAFPGYIQTVCVALGRRDAGIGTALIRHAEERVFRESRNVFLCVSSFNAGARRLYERLGYEPVGELRDYLVRGHSEVLMRKTTGPLWGK